MQFDPERYPVQDFKFVPLSTMGMVAREYEQQQLVGLMQTLGPSSPITPVLLQGIIQSSSLSNRQEIITQLQQMSQPKPPDPMEEQMHQIAMQTAMAQLQKTQAEAGEAQTRAQQMGVETQLLPVEMQIKAISAQQNTAGMDEFSKAEKLANLALKEADIQSNERIAIMQMQGKMQ
jgi:hypothetical protein